MGKLKTAVVALVVLVALGACLGAVDDDENGETEIEENGEEEAQTADEEQDDGQSDGTDDNGNADEEEQATDEEDLPDPDEGDDSEAVDESEEVDEAEAEIEEETDSEADQETLQAAGPLVLESTLVDNGIMVDTVEEQGDVLYVEYTTFESTEEALAGEIGAVSGAYAGISGEGYQSDRMEVSIRGANGDEIGTFHVDSDDARAYYNGEITDEQYFDIVLNTLVA